ncbi:uncharacterized protein G2W53_025882 [Senna tora]|uniref:Uncharacterized protein n=1 Tax=Senna tora TaxID=362788 RepID=A0A834TFX9_9FABA|nr:uncharacterized protein G2W53_025882 [Senna tora]
MHTGRHTHETREARDPSTILITNESFQTHKPGMLKELPSALIL